MKNYRILFSFALALFLFSCQKDDIENPNIPDIFELKVDKNGLISSPKWLAIKVDSVAHAFKDVAYPDVLKISTASDFYIYITENIFSSTNIGLYFQKDGKRILSSDSRMAEIQSSLDRDVLWKKDATTKTRTLSWPTALVYTPKGSLVPDTYYIPELLVPSQVAAFAAQVSDVYPDAQIIADATSTYNCHGYAWSIVENGETVWMGAETNPTAIFWLDGSYMGTSSTSATKIAYLSDNHSAVRTGTPNIYISKWGNGPLVRHRKDDSPYNYSSLSYLKLDDRPDIYIGQNNEDYLGSGPTIYTANSHGEFTLYAYTPHTVVNRFVWNVRSFDGIYDRWYDYPNNDSLRFSIYFNQPGNGGRLNVSCTMYNGSTLVGTANYSVAVVYQ